MFLKGWAIKADFGLGTSSIGNPDGNPENELLFDLGLGYNFNEKVYLGIATGVNGPNGVNGFDKHASIPLLADFTYYFVYPKAAWIPFLQVRGGYMLSTKSEYTKGKNTVDAANFTTFDATAGLLLNLTEHHALRLGVGYKRNMKGEGQGNNCNSLIGKIGMVYKF